MLNFFIKNILLFLFQKKKSSFFYRYKKKKRIGKISFKNALTLLKEKKEVVNYEAKDLPDYFKEYLKSRRKDVVVYRLILKVTRNNVFITVIDPLYGFVYYSSGGLKYFFLRKDSVAVANILLGENLALELRAKFINVVDVEFYGLPFKSHRKNFIKGLRANHLIVRSIIDKTPIAHNGCYRKKRRRKKLRRR